MKTPPLLLLAALAFWGWQSGLLAIGVTMGVILESARLVKVRWELSDTDFRRIMTFCTLLALTATLYVFTANQEAGGGFQGSFNTVSRVMGISSLKTSTTFFRWLPMFLFLFVAAQTFSTRDKIPLTAISIISRWRAQREQKRGEAMEGYGINVSYPYFIICIYAASIHSNDNQGNASFFWGLCVLMIWALCRFRSRRFDTLIWILAMTVVLALSYFGQGGIGVLQRSVERYNVQWLSHFIRMRTDPTESITSMGQIGELKLSGRIVIRLWTTNNEPPPTYLREASYRGYRSDKRSWYSGSPRSEFTDINNLIPHQSDQTTWVLLPGKTNAASVKIACYLIGRAHESGTPQGLLPLPSGSGRLENLNAFVLHHNSEGAVLVEGPGLLVFDARYGPGATIDAPADEHKSATNLDYLVPTNEVPALNSVISEMNISGTNEEQKLLAVRNFFSSKFTYSLWQGEDKLATTNESSLTRFLLHSRSGHCEYFATATVLLLREMGILARYAVGYAVYEHSLRGYVVRERDAHAWCLVWNRQKQTWEDFDTTPASWVGIEGKRASMMQWFSDFWSWIGFQISKFRWGQSNLRDYILWALIPVLALLLYQIVFRRGRKRQQLKHIKNQDTAIFWPGLDSEFYQLEAQLAARGVARRPDEPLTDWLTRALDDPALADLRVPLQELLLLHYRHRFDPRGLSPEERELLKREAKVCLDRLAHANQAA